MNEAFEIFQPTTASDQRSSPTHLLLSQAAPSLPTRQHQSSPPVLAMGVKEGPSQGSKRRFTPESRKENGFEDLQQTQQRHVYHAAQQSSSSETPAKRHQASVMSPNLLVRSHMLLPVVSSSSGPLHPLHSNAASSPAVTSSGHTTTASAHQNHMSSRAALMEQAVAAVAHEAAMFRVTNGSSSPPNGHNGPSNGRLPHSVPLLDPHFDRDRVYSALEKEVMARNGPNHGKMHMSTSSSSSYPDVRRSYSEEATRDSEEEWRNIHTVS